MRYYVVSDVHGFYSILKSSLANAGFFRDTEPHTLLILGDLFDGGKEARALQDFILDLMERDEVILIRGNHEDQFVETFASGRPLPHTHKAINEIYDTALQLTGYDWVMAQLRHYDFVDKARATPFYRDIIPAMLDYFETEHYIFTHGWVPCSQTLDGAYRLHSDWRGADERFWLNARWVNGMDAAQTASVEGKTVICGHCPASYGHAMIESKKAAWLDAGANFAPYYGNGIIAIDACTALSKIINVLVLEDKPLI